MKKHLLLAIAILLCATSAKAGKRVEKFGVFNHVAIGAGAGSTGIGFQIAAPITDFVQMRLGYSFMPSGRVSYTKGINYTHGGTEDKTDVKFKMNMGDANLLFDLYPSKKATFHFTVGAYLGKERPIEAYNTSPISGVAPGEGLIIGDYVIGPDANGIARAAIQVKKFKPYVGIGVGRACPRKRISVSGDLGVTFWGSPGVYGQDDTGKYTKVDKKDTGKGGEKIFDSLSKIKIYPCINIRINGRIF